MIEPLHLAYIDPWSGAFLVQLLLGGLAGAALFLRHQGRRLLGWFVPRKEKDSGAGGP
jgi:hypothetical protein